MLFVIECSSALVIFRNLVQGEGGNGVMLDGLRRLSIGQYVMTPYAYAQRADYATGLCDEEIDEFRRMLRAGENMYSPNSGTTFRILR